MQNNLEDLQKKMTTTTTTTNNHFEYACKLNEVAQAFWNLNLVAHQYDVEFLFINVLLESALSRSRRCDIRCSQRSD